MPEIEETEPNLSQTLRLACYRLVRRRWLIVAIALTVAFGTVIVLFRIPDRYTSTATLFVVRQQVPERYVVSTSTADISQTLEAMVQEALSRPRLLAIIDELGLYPEQRKHLSEEEVIEIARRDVSIEPLKDRGFRISFIANSPRLAQAVTKRLTTLFVEQNLKSRADQATITTSFLHEQLEVAKDKLVEQEQRLRDFKMQYLGELPEQQQGNLGILTGLQNQLENVQATRNQAQQQRLYLESLLGEYHRLARRGYVPNGPGVAPGVTALESAQRDLARLKGELLALLTAYTKQHPDVLRKDREVKAHEALVYDLSRNKSVSAPDAIHPAEPPAKEDDDGGAAQLRSQLQANALELENLAKKEQRLRRDVELYQGRLNSTPVREQQLTSMQRDYELLKQNYGDLLKKEQESQLATSLEKRQEGQQFRLADPPNLPSKPSSPKRLKISLIALALGILAGCGLALIIDAGNPVFYSESDLSRQLALPLVIGIPAFFTPAEVRTRSWTRAFEWAGASALIAALAFVELYVFSHG